MKRLVQRISAPLLLLVGLALLGPQTAEAGKWRRQARRASVHQHHYVAPPVVYTPRVRVDVPRVRVYAPSVGVHVGPGVHVDAPGVRVHVGSRYPFYYERSHYYGW
jgi:hypothetical protein